MCEQGDGLLVVDDHSGDPIPLSLASIVLTQALQRMKSPPTEAALAQPGGWSLLRVEAKVVGAGPQGSLLMDWLLAQRELRPRALFAARDGSDLIVGAGSCHTHRLDGPRSVWKGDECLLPQLSRVAHHSIRYVGGMRFDSSNEEAFGDISLEWQPFAHSYWFLPRIDVSIGERRKDILDDSHSGRTDSSLASTALLDADNGLFGGAGRAVSAYFAVNLRWRSSPCGDGFSLASPSVGREHCEVKGTCVDNEGWTAERDRALRALAQIQMIGARGSGPLPSHASKRSEETTKEEFEAQVQEALKAFQTGEMTKVVLARRVDLELTQAVDPLALLKQVVGDGQKRSFLFVLEPEDGAAFISLTPERLCRVNRRDIWTEAVAGTWPIEEFERNGEAALLGSSEKHTAEHQQVVDYLCNLLSGVSEHVKVCDSHILKLKHLVHIKQSYHAVARLDSARPGSPLSRYAGYRSRRPDHEDNSALGLGEWFCNQMSPTPAVGGLPVANAHRFISKAEKFDRGYYAAPCGVVGAQSVELIVAIRSALLRDGRRLSVYAGAGIVSGSNPAEEFAEITLKMKQFTDAVSMTAPNMSTVEARLGALRSTPNLNTLWANLIVEELVRTGMRRFVICPGSRSTPLTVAVARHPLATYVINHDERGAAYYALGWAKVVAAPVAVIVTSGTAVANLLPGVVEASQASVPLLLLTADRPHELRDTGSNQTITQPGIFGTYPRWVKDFPPPSIEYPIHALLGDVDLAVAHASGDLGGHPGPVHLNFCLRENLAPDSGVVRGAPERDSSFPSSYVDTPGMCRWIEDSRPRSVYKAPVLRLQSEAEEVVKQLVTLARGNNKVQPGRIVVLVGALRSPEEVLLAEDIGLRLGAAIFADITSGLRQRPSVVNYGDQLLNSPLLAGDVMQVDAIVHLGGQMSSARLQGFAKAAAPRLYVRVALAPVRSDPDFLVTHHLPGCLEALAEALVVAGLPRAAGPPPFWRRLNDVAGEELEALLTAQQGLTEPFVAHIVSRYANVAGRILLSSSMPIRDMDFYARPSQDASSLSAPCQPPFSNRGASGIDGVISTAIGVCKGAYYNLPVTLVIGDTAALHDMNALQQLTGPNAPSQLTIVVVNNGGGGIFSFLPIARHTDSFSPFFDAPHETDFQKWCQAFGLKHTACETASDFEAAYIPTQQNHRNKKPSVIEVRVAPSRAENVAFHKLIGEVVADRVRTELLDQVHLSWTLGQAAPSSCIDEKSGAISTVADPSGASRVPQLLLHGWLGEKSDWATVAAGLARQGERVLTVDLPGHGRTRTDMRRRPTMMFPSPWEDSAFFSLPMVVELVADLLDRLDIPLVSIAGYSLGGRVAMAFAAKHPKRVSGIVACSAHPGLKNAGERHFRWEADSRLAAKLEAMSSGGAGERSSIEFESFLKEWYSTPLWAGLQDRRPEVYERMVDRRRRTVPKLAACALRGYSLAKQADLWPTAPKSSMSKAPRMRYVSGALDEKFSVVASKLQGACPTDTLHEAGHALVEECPEQLVAILSDSTWLQEPDGAVAPEADGGPAHQANGGNPTALEAPASTATSSSVTLLRAWTCPLELALRTPLALSRGEPMTHRSGHLVVLEAEVSTSSSSSPIIGIGEVSPLPFFHKETLAEAIAQLNEVLRQWSSSPPVIPRGVARLDGSLQLWLNQNRPGSAPLLPSVRAGLEMAVLHLLGRAFGSPHLGVPASVSRGLLCHSEVGINSLIAREEELCDDTCVAAVLKLKVGREPASDAEKTNRIALTLREKVGPHARLRLDANQAWSVADATAFVAALSPEALAAIEYIEEPVSCSDGTPEALLRAWEEFAEKTGGRLSLAADESLTELGIGPQHLEACKAPIRALILKPALQGLENTVALTLWASHHGARAVFSSAFESGIALSHFAILASIAGLSTDHVAYCTSAVGSSFVSACHGLGTFNRLAEDVLQPPFNDLVVRSHSGWQVDPLRCQAALDRTANALVSQRTTRSASWERCASIGSGS